MHTDTLINFRFRVCSELPANTSQKVYNSFFWFIFLTPESCPHQKTHAPNTKPTLKHVRPQTLWQSMSVHKVQCVWKMHGSQSTLLRCPYMDTILCWFNSMMYISICAQGSLSFLTDWLRLRMALRLCAKYILTNICSRHSLTHIEHAPGRYRRDRRKKNSRIPSRSRISVEAPAGPAIYYVFLRPSPLAWLINIVYAIRVGVQPVRPDALGHGSHTAHSTQGCDSQWWPFVLKWDRVMCAEAVCGTRWPQTLDRKMVNKQLRM